MGKKLDRIVVENEWKSNQKLCIKIGEKVTEIVVKKQIENLKKKWMIHSFKKNVPKNFSHSETLAA